MIQFAKEPLTDALWAEAMPLLKAHWKEVAHYQDIPLNPDRDLYAASEEAGILRVFTARDHWHGDVPGTRRLINKPSGEEIPLPDGSLVGYSLYFVRPAPHYQGSVQAVQDVLYIAPDHRGRTALKLINYCDEQLQAEGVQAVYVHLKAGKANGHRAVLHLGYDEVDRIYAKRLDGPVMGDDWTEQAQHDYDTARFVGHPE